MVRILIGLMFFISCSAGSRAQDEKELPKGPNPRIVTAKADPSGKLIITQVALQFVTVQEKRIVDRSGMKIELVVNVTKSVPVHFRESYPTKDIRFYGSDGKEMTTAKAVSALEKPTPILFSADGRSVDPYYLRLFKEGTMVMVVPENVPSMSEPMPVQKP